MISGRQALAQLETAITEARRDETRLDQALTSATETAERLRADQATAFRRLAEIRLDSMAGQTLSRRIDETERQALALLAEKRKALADLAARRTAAAEGLAAAQKARHGIAGRLEEITGRLDALREKTEARLAASDAAWAAAAARVKEAEETIARAEAKLKQASEDRTAKGAPYEADRLFMYLWDNGFATGRYSAGPFVRFFDRKVANLIGFVDARANYAVLTEIPVRLAGHVDRLKADLAERVAERVAVERKALVADGIETIEAEFAAVKAEIDAENAGIAGAQTELTTLDASHGALVSGDDPALGRALDAVAASLAETDLKTLYADAFATPTPEDEGVVRRIEELGNAVAKAEHEIADTRETIRETARRRNELEATRDRFVTSGYDRPGVSFNNENMIGQMIGGIIGGIISSPELWRVILGGYHEPPRRRDDWFGGPSGGGTWGGGGGSSGGSSGGFGGDGGFSTGGGFGGDDNSTGGGF